MDDQGRTVPGEEVSVDLFKELFPTDEVALPHFPKSPVGCDFFFERVDLFECSRLAQDDPFQFAVDILHQAVQVIGRWFTVQPTGGVFVVIVPQHTFQARS